MHSQKQTLPPVRKWTFLIYIAGDNNLSNAGLEDIRELCEEGASEDVYVGVEIDTCGEFTGSIRYEITEKDWWGQAHRKVIERLSEKDTGDPQTLADFITWGLERFPAENLITVIWNHGSGFRSVRRDIGYDDFGSSLDMPEINLAFSKAGISSRNQIGILGFDACLMNMVEIVNHFKDHVRIVAGSQQTEPGDGWPYNKVLRAIKHSDNIEQLSAKIVEEYIKDYRSSGIQDVTQSAVSTLDTEPVIIALDVLGIALTKYLKQDRVTLSRVRMMLQSFAMADYVDLKHLAQLLKQHINQENIRNLAEQMIQTLDGCIIASESFGNTVKDANGLSVWFPATQDLYFRYRSKYLRLNCNENGFGWVDFLDAYHL